ncbi:BON domain-containing protein [Gemmata sp. G18]|uniref:BON domain-containing protein n=1 Tax=Gemmata palustris TaxID=2822762 RepID=A0ABS5BVY6_9BACT|nr:BON domain-containing protein [Gemmata palustris]MBP3957879.1 BON domain-containing protein [Gemmata palustris]
MFSHLPTSKTLRTLAALTCVAGAVGAGALFAADPFPPAAPVLPPLPPGAPVSKPVAISDVALARTALAVFDADPVLKDVNILVSVVDRGAVIGGPVSSEAVKKRAEAVVRAVPGIESVKNTCFIEADPDPLMRAVADRMKPGTKPTGSTALPGIVIPPGAAEGYIPPVPPPLPTDLVAAAPKTVVVQHPTSLGPPVVGLLGAPVAPHSVAKVPSTAPTVPSTAPGALTGSTSGMPTDVLAAVAAIRAADARFARLAVELKPDGGLFVTGFAANIVDVRDFATEARKVPGVVRVAVDPSLVK